MGLDMYLYKKSYLAGDNEWIRPEYRTQVSITIGGKEYDASKVKYIIEEVGYWRKANHIHKWFVDGVQGGQDDCREYEVTVDQLKALRDICTRVLENREEAYQLLPTRSGFFFGSTDYDEYYFEDLSGTLAILNDALSESKLDPYSTFYYRASW